ncbi:MAG TPA: UpxY family transcription antiterminator [Bacteroidales bacterium]|nr:UpxY family transcription antiterminator [Bacteroidales bacterium]
MKSFEKHWYALYTAPRAEKKVSERFTEAGIEHYLPLQTVKRKWSDRIKEVIVPVIHGYIFVRIAETEFRNVLSIYGAISFVREFYKPVPIPDPQIQRLRFMCDFSDEPVEFSLEEFTPGITVTICKGPLQGLMGELIEVKGKHKVVIRLEKFGCALTTVPLSFIKTME